MISEMEIRWRTLLFVKANAPHPVPDSLILRELSAASVCPSLDVLRLELEYLEAAGMLEVDRAESWLCRPTPAGYDMARGYEAGRAAGLFGDGFPRLFFIFPKGSLQ